MRYWRTQREPRPYDPPRAVGDQVACLPGVVTRAGDATALPLASARIRHVADVSRRLRRTKEAAPALRGRPCPRSRRSAHLLHGATPQVNIALHTQMTFLRPTRDRPRALPIREGLRARQVRGVARRPGGGADLLLVGLIA